MPFTQSQLTQLTVMNWLLAGGGFSVVSICLGSLFARGKKPITYVTSALGTSIGLSVLIYLAQSLGLLKACPALLFTYYPFMLLAGTLLFFFFTLLVEPGFPLASPYLLLFSPVIAATGLMMPYFLRVHPEQAILDVAFDCGFGSKSAFNAAFSQATGKTPREWKREGEQ